MTIHSAELKTVCGITSKLPENDLPEVAFCGRSNVGKSSLINTLMNRKALARTSGKPGKTQTINYYLINNELYLVDLPGYGYAKISKDMREKWGEMIQSYLVGSEKLYYVFQLIDIRHKPTKDDISMYEWLRFLNFQPIIIATKADKLKPYELKRNAEIVKSELEKKEQKRKDLLVIPFSSVDKTGLNTVLDLLSQVLEQEG